MTPADVVMAELGVRGLARILDVAPSTICRWRRGQGNVPSGYHKKILEIADGKITADDLVYGR